MIAECRKRGVLVLVDAAHAPGQIKVNVEDLNPDFYTGTFHKWVYTPRGCAILWIAKEHHNWCTPLVTSHMYKKGVQLEYFMQGTRDNIPYFLVPDALEFYNEIGGMVKMNFLKYPIHFIIIDIYKLPKATKTTKNSSLKLFSYILE